MVQQMVRFGWLWAVLRKVAHNDLAHEIETGVANVHPGVPDPRKAERHAPALQAQHEMCLTRLQVSSHDH